MPFARLGVFLQVLLLQSYLPTGVFCETGSQVPIVLWHGMGDSCCNPLSLGTITSLLEAHIDNVYVKSLRIGESFVEDTVNGFFLDVNTQVEEACRLIADDDKLKNGYHAIGFSQGSQFLRAVAQRCPSPKMRVLVSLGGQHQGVYGLPHCFYPEHSWCDYVRRILTQGAYLKWVQKGLVQAQYWHDPRFLDQYREHSLFLADINNERLPRNTSYATNLAQLEKLVLVRFNNDSMVLPVASEWFEFYAPGQAVEIQPLEESAIYKEDWIGLKRLDTSGRLHRLAIDGDHLKFTEEWFLSTIVDKYLKT
ncbi:palmitoyl-protein thioesterase 1-like [Thrips palmi]|uniref:Palmitoyl-protein thioesterase 1 n=1 Tax=Thrips palmi TaxID=161013 RepID=A0A6P8Z0A1_THRPL|nr:palmitoyl-protein thioesterase 1-like [Thrips palmi]